MGQWLSWIKSNEKALLKILDNLAKKAVCVAVKSWQKHFKIIRNLASEK